MVANWFSRQLTVSRRLHPKIKTADLIIPDITHYYKRPVSYQLQSFCIEAATSQFLLYCTSVQQGLSLLSTIILFLQKKAWILLIPAWTIVSFTATRDGDAVKDKSRLLGKLLPKKNAEIFWKRCKKCPKKGSNQKHRSFFVLVASLTTWMNELCSAACQKTQCEGFFHWMSRLWFHFLHRKWQHKLHRHCCGPTSEPPSLLQEKWQHQFHPALLFIMFSSCFLFPLSLSLSEVCFRSSAAWLCDWLN